MNHHQHDAFEIQTAHIFHQVNVHEIDHHVIMILIVDLSDHILATLNVEFNDHEVVVRMLQVERDPVHH